MRVFVAGIVTVLVIEFLVLLIVFLFRSRKESMRQSLPISKERLQMMIKDE